MTTLIQVQHLSKNYGSHRGIQDVSFTIEEGEVFGFLGPNGAGKTTTIRLLMGLLKPTAGSAQIGGLDCWTNSTKVKRLLGYLPGEYAFDQNLRGAQILEYLGNLRGGVDRSYLRQLIERLDFDPSKRFREYSRGNKQKIGLVQAFMHRPRLLILDEPTGGLDPLNQQEFYQMVREVNGDGRTVFLSSHVLPEVEHTCDRVGIIREGQLVEINAVAKLKDLKQSDVEISFAGPASPEWFRALPQVINAVTANNGKGVHLTISGDLHDILKVAALHDATHIVNHEPSLEEVFLRFYEKDRVPAHANRSAL
jgi:ABC-2 type transport system ATP-binding protein